MVGKSNQKQEMVTTVVLDCVQPWAIGNTAKSHGNDHGWLTRIVVYLPAMTFDADTKYCDSFTFLLVIRQ